MLKKLITIAICQLLTVNCFAQQSYSYNTLDDATSYVGTYAPVSCPMAYGQDGVLYTTGLYDKIVMIGDDILEPVATSAYLSAVDPSTSSEQASGKRKWTVGIMGAARITAITATSKAVYIAGVFADDITLGSEDQETVDYSGTALSHDMVNGFVARYSLEGNLQASKVILPHRIAKYGETEYESDLMVYPTAIAAFNGKLYLSLTFMGGYDVDSFSKDGNVKSSYGYWDSKCADVISFSASDLSKPECTYDLRNSEDVNTNGYAPTSICLTATSDMLYISAFTSQNCTETLLKTEKKFEAGSEESTYYLTLHAIDKGGADKSKVFSSTSDRAYINNIIKTMHVTDGNLYLAGCASSPLPMDNSVVPDLWCDEFAACFSASDFKADWASITGAKRDDMATTNEKYRQATDAAFSKDIFIVIGSTNFKCDADGTQSAYSTDYCLGIADNGPSFALSTKTDTGSTLTVTGYGSGIKMVQENKSSRVQECYNLAGQELGKNGGGLYIQQGKKITKY